MAFEYADALVKAPDDLLGVQGQYIGTQQRQEMDCREGFGKNITVANLLRWRP